MSIAADLIRGHTDAIILAHLLLHDSYGYEINKAIAQKTDNKFELKEATLYTAFKRLEDADYISSYWGDQQSGARRKYYKITSAGKEAYSEMTSNWEATKEIIDKLLEAKECLK